MEEAGWTYKRVTSLLAGDGYVISPPAVLIDRWPARVAGAVRLAFQGVWVCRARISGNWALRSRSKPWVIGGVAVEELKAVQRVSI